MFSNTLMSGTKDSGPLRGTGVLKLIPTLLLLVYNILQLVQV
jgi:hypothetical protein